MPHCRNATEQKATLQNSHSAEMGNETIVISLLLLLVYVSNWRDITTQNKQPAKLD